MSKDDRITLLWRGHLPGLREAGGWAAQFEFYVRMSAEALWGTGATDKDLDGIFERVVNELRPRLEPGQLEALTSTNLCQLRHDLLHCRSSKAYGKLGGKTNDPSVARTVTIGKDESPLDAVMRAVGGAAVPIAQTKTSDSGVLIWLIQLGVTEKFSMASQLFERACDALQGGLEARSMEILRRPQSGEP